MTLLDVAQLTAGYGARNVVHGVDLQVNEGEVVVVLGANGAGKTTTIRAISGVINRRGHVRLDGTDISRSRPEDIVRRGIAMVPEGRGTFPDLTVEDNLRMGGYIRKDDLTESLTQWYDLFPRLRERRTQRAGSLSGGEQQMLAIARALMSSPRLLLCDEPSLGLAPLITKGLFETLRRLNQEQGVAILLVEQNARLAMSIANRVYLLEAGRVVTTGSASDLADDVAIREAYLGY